MNINVLFGSVCGSVCGFVYFLFELESPDMGNILFRVNSAGNKVFSFDSLIGIILAPFKYNQFWTNTDLYSINWIITTFIGGVIGYILTSS